MNILRFCILGLYLSMNGCIKTGQSTNTPQQMFEYVIERPIPASIKNLQGGGYTWQGYSIFLRFTADKSFVDKLVKDGYTQTDWNKIEEHFKLPEELQSNFTPPWDPTGVKNMRCLENNVRNDWTHAGTHYFVIDENSYTVYFYGVGA